MEFQLLQLIRQCMVPEFKKGDERPINESDFKDFKIKSVENFRNLKSYFISIFSNEPAKICEARYAIELCIVIGENHSSFPWNDQVIQSDCSDLLAFILGKASCTLEQALVSGLKVDKACLQPLAKPMLLAIQPKLLKETWKNHPASVCCYKWILTSISSPNLSDFIQFVLPTALILCDDFVTENKAMGIECLSHIIDNVTVADLEFHGDLIFDALRRSLYISDASVIKFSIPCALKLLSKYEKSRKKEKPFIDDVYEIFANLIAMEHNLERRKIYLSLYISVLKALDVKIIKYSKGILLTITQYLIASVKISDFESLLMSYDAMEFLFTATCSFNILFKSFFPLLCEFYYWLNLIPNTSSSYTAAIEKINSCLQIISQLSKTEDMEKELRDTHLRLQKKCHR